jgi:phospholipid/cholesterol/gamma-HCH transport system ATP-binding protein
MSDINAAKTRFGIRHGKQRFRKSTLLRHMIGLQRPTNGDVLYDGKSFWVRTTTRVVFNCRIRCPLSERRRSSMTFAENVALPWSNTRIGHERATSSGSNCAVGLSGFEEYYPAEISGGMRKTRASHWRP